MKRGEGTAGDGIPDATDAISRASRGDPEAVEELLGRYLPDLEAYIGRRASARVRMRESVSDLAQSVCRELLERLADGRFRYRGEPQFRQWLYRAALLKVLGRHRFWGGAGRDGEGALPEFAATADTPSQHAIAHEELARLESSFSRLPERYQEVIGLAYVDRQTHAEIAAELEITESHSRVLLARALAALGRLGVDLN